MVNEGNLFVSVNFVQRNSASLQNSSSMTVQGDVEIRLGTFVTSTNFLAIGKNLINLSSENALSGNGKVQFFGTNFASVGGNFNTNFYDLEINRQFLTVTRTCTIANNLNFVSGMVHFPVLSFLSANATISNEASQRYATGLLQTTRNINATTENFGGLGVSLNPNNQNLGQISLIRKAGVGTSEIHLGKNSINRTWEFITTNANVFTSAVDLTFQWLSDDDNNVDLTDSHIWHKAPHKNGAWIGMNLPSNNNTRNISVSSKYFPSYKSTIPVLSLNKFTVGGVGTVTISGTITEIGFGLANVTATASNGNFSFSNADGFYSLSLRAGFQGNITPSKTDAVGLPYVFTSASLPFISVFEDVPNQNFTAMGVYSIRGKALEIDRPLADTKIVLANGFTTITNSQGNYLAFVSSGFKGDIQAIQTDYFFTASPRVFENKLRNVTNIDFSGRRFYTIIGQILEAKQKPLPNAFITTDIGFTTVSNEQGFYVAFVSSGFTGQIQVNKPNFIFEPLAYTFNKVLEPHQNKDFIAMTSYQITGKITENGLPLANTKLSLENNFTTISDANGFYTAFVSSAYAGKITPSKLGYAFVATEKSFIRVFENQKNIDFEAKTLYRIEGNVVENGIGVKDVSINLSNGDKFLTDQNGFYTAFVSSGFTGTATANKKGYYFKPSSISFVSVGGQANNFDNQSTSFANSKLINQDFEAFGLQKIEGKIVFNGKALENVQIIDHLGEIVESDKNGFFTAFVSANGNTTLTPYKKHYEFNPISLKFVSVNKTTQSQTFEAKLVKYPILGQILLNEKTPLANVKIQSASFTTITDQNGFYTVYQEAGFSGIIRPDSLLDYFRPAFISVQEVFSTVSKIDFAVQTAPISLEIKGNGKEQNGKMIYCSKVDLELDLTKILLDLQKNSTFLWSNKSTKPILSTEKEGIYFVSAKIPTYYPTSFSKEIFISPDILTVKWGKDTTICIGSTVLLEADQKAQNRQWQRKNGENFVDLPNTNANNQNVGQGIYRLQMSNGICEVNYEIEVKFAEEQVLPKIEKLYYFCNNQEPVIVDAQNKNSVRYEWQNGNEIVSQKSTAEFNKGGNYILKVTDQYGCTKETTFEINDTERLENRFLFQTEVRVGDTVVFVNMSRKLESSKTDAKTAFWDFGGLGTATDLEQTEFIFDKKGEFDIKLKVANDNCVTEKSKKIIVKEMPQGGRAEKIYPFELLEKMQTSLYPNPAKTNFNLLLKDFVFKTAQLNIYDRFGREILNKEISTENPLLLDCSHWQYGIYLVKITSGKVVKTLRFVKE